MTANKIQTEVDVASLHTFEDVFEACKNILDTAQEISKKDPALFAQLVPRSKLSLVKDFGLDSLDLIELPMAFEEVLKITISDDELSRLTNFDEYVEMVAGKLGIAVG